MAYQLILFQPGGRLRLPHYYWSPPPPEISPIPMAFLKFREPILPVLNTCQDLIIVKKFEFFAHSVRLLDTKFKAKHCWSIIYELKICLVSPAMFCLYTFSAQAKIRMLTTSCWIFIILLTSFLKSLGL